MPQPWHQDTLQKKHLAGQNEKHLVGFEGLKLTDDSIHS